MIETSAIGKNPTNEYFQKKWHSVKSPIQVILLRHQMRTVWNLNNQQVRMSIVPGLY